MCITIYLASDQPLRLFSWPDEAPQFQVCEMIEDDKAVKQQFELPYIRYVSSYGGCGCGFQYGEYPQYEDDDRPKQRASLDAFAAYLELELKRGATLQIFACWDGDQTAKPEQARALTPSALRSETFFFLQKELSTVSADAV